MKRKQGFGSVVSLGLIVLGVIAFAASPAGAATAAGPYYASPSWDQTLPSDTRFIVLSNMGSNAVLDRETGLVWEKSLTPTGIGSTWYEAQERCINLQTGGRLGWRLPTLQELASLLDPSVVTGVPLPAGHPFSGVQFLPYWSATTAATGTNTAWLVFFETGFQTQTGFGGKDNRSGLVWCVRGGQGVDPQ